MAGGLFAPLFRFFLWFTKQNDKFRSIKQDEEQASRSVYFGVRAICFIVIGLPVGFLIAYGGVMLASGGDVFPTILGVLAIIAGILIALVMLPYSLTSSIFQLKMNKKPIGIISLVLLLVVIIGAAIAILYLAEII